MNRKVVKPKIQQARFSYGNNFYWCPTTDFGVLPSSSDSTFEEIVKNPLITFVTDEELTHSLFFHGTFIAFQMSWQESLTNLEFISLLEIAKTSNIKLKIPIEKNLNLTTFPSELKKKIKNIIKSCRLISEYAIMSSPILEAITLETVEHHHSDLIKKYEKINKSFIAYKKSQFLNYPKLEFEYNLTKICFNKLDRKVNMGSVLLNIFNPYIKNYHPPLSLEESFKTFNSENARDIQKRWRKINSRLPENISKNDDIDNISELLGIRRIARDTVEIIIEWCVTNAMKKCGGERVPYFFYPLIPHWLKIRATTGIHDKENDYEILKLPSLLLIQSRLGHVLITNKIFDSEELEFLIASQILTDIKYFYVSGINGDFIKYASRKLGIKSLYILDDFKIQIFHSVAKKIVKNVVDKY